MKVYVLMLAISYFCTSMLFAKNNPETNHEVFYGVSTSIINTGSGNGFGLTLNASVTSGRKSIEVGLIYSDREGRIAGADLKYRVFLGTIPSLHTKEKIYTAFLQYNMVYQKGISYSAEIVNLGNETYVVETDPGIIATIGHYVAFGNKVNLSEKFYFDSSIGLGYYIGSLEKIDGPGTWGIHYYNGGFTYSLKIGFGYLFK